MHVTLACYRLLLSFGIFFLVGSTAMACSKNLNVSWSDWAPYQYMDDQGEITGIDITIIRMVLERAGCQYHFREMPWKRVLAEVEAGSVDLAMGASKTAERQRFALFSAAYRREYMVLFIRKADGEKYHLTNLKDIMTYPDLRMGALRGSWYGEDFSDLSQHSKLFKQQLHQNNDYILLFKWLRISRVDAVINDLYNGFSLARDLGMTSELAVHPLVVNDNFVHFMLSRKSMTESDLNKINTAVQSLINEGAFDDIIKAYIPEQYADFFPQR